VNRVNYEKLFAAKFDPGDEARLEKLRARFMETS